MNNHSWSIFLRFLYVVDDFCDWFDFHDGELNSAKLMDYQLFSNSQSLFGRVPGAETRMRLDQGRQQQTEQERWDRQKLI